MKSNMGGSDRVIRAIIGAALIVLGLTGVLGGVLAILSYIVGGILILTAITSFCPLYLPFGVDTHKSKSGESQPPAA
ncbi:MAG: DUF2892 domain-containing protein [Calditrichia bacterium]